MEKNYSVKDGNLTKHYNSYGEKIGESYTRDGMFGTKETVHYNKSGNLSKYSVHDAVDANMGIGGFIVLIIMAGMVIVGLFSNTLVGICVIGIVDFSIIAAILYARFPHNEIVIISWYQFFCLLMNALAIIAADGEGFVIVCLMCVSLATIFFALFTLESAGSIAVFIILYPAITLSMLGNQMRPSAGTAVILTGVFIVDSIITFVSSLTQSKDKDETVYIAERSDDISISLNKSARLIAIIDIAIIVIAAHAELFWTIAIMKAGANATISLTIFGYIICLIWALAMVRSVFFTESWMGLVIWGVLSIPFLIALPGAQNVLNGNLGLGFFIAFVMIVTGVFFALMLEKYYKSRLEAILKSDNSDSVSDPENIPIKVVDTKIVAKLPEVVKADIIVAESSKTVDNAVIPASNKEKNIVSDKNSIHVKNKFLPDGSVYNGTIKDGKRHGYGELKFANGEIYRGEFHDGYYEGQGQYHYPPPYSAVYTGEFHKGKKHGSGEFAYKNGKKKRVTFSHDSLDK